MKAEVLLAVIFLWSIAGLSITLAVVSFWRHVWISCPRVLACSFFAIAAPSLAYKFTSTDRMHIEGLFMTAGVVLVMAEELLQALKKRRERRKTQRTLA